MQTAFRCASLLINFWTSSISIEHRLWLGDPIVTFASPIAHGIPSPKDEFHFESTPALRQREYLFTHFRAASAGKEIYAVTNFRLRWVVDNHQQNEGPIVPNVSCAFSAHDHLHKKIIVSKKVLSHFGQTISLFSDDPSSDPSSESDSDSSCNSRDRLEHWYYSNVTKHTLEEASSTFHNFSSNPGRTVATRHNYRFAILDPRMSTFANNVILVPREHEKALVV
jgi:hypothetical protein